MIGTKKKKIAANLKYRDLLCPIFRGGKRVYHLPSLQQIQAKARQEINQFHPSIMRLLYPNPYFVGLEKNLFDFKAKMMEKISENSSDCR